MSPRKSVARKVLRAFLPIALILALVVLTVGTWLVYGITRPPRAPYLVTPKTFEKDTGMSLSKATDAKWKNHDGTEARGWVITGADEAPAVILLHGYGADRSWLLNMAVKLNETTNFTVLWPDLRGHGENPPVNSTSFGAQEGDDVTAAIDYLRTLKSPTGKPQIGQHVGIYGVGLGAYVALDAANRYADIRALALDSVPASPDDVVRAATITRTGLSSSAFQRLAHVGVRIYGLGRFPSKTSCDLAQTLRDVHVLLLTGVQDQWQQSTLDLARCLKTPPEIKKGLNISGVVLPFTTGEQEETYDRPVIEFFGKSLQ